MARALDLAALPLPNIVETLDFEAILTAMTAEFRTRWPEFTAALESDPVIKLLEVAAWRELLLRARVNEAAGAGMLATARGADLDQLAARFNTARRAGEADAGLRQRAQLGFHQVAAAGSRERYWWHALDAHAAISQADVWQMAPGQVGVSPLGWILAPTAEVDPADAVIGAALWGPPPTGMAYRVAASEDPPFVAVRLRLLGDDVCPVGVDVRLAEPAIVTYQATAVLHLPPGPDVATVTATARAAVAALVRDRARFRMDVYRAALVAALMVPSVRNVTLISPAQDIARGPGELAVCAGITLTAAVADD